MTSSWVVLKFGGTSVSSRARWDSIAGIIEARRKEGLRPLVVCSAFSGVSNELERLCKDAARGAHAEVLAALEARHREMAEMLGLFFDIARPLMDELASYAAEAARAKATSPQLHARIMAMGELLATTMGAAYLTARGTSAVWRDVREFLTSQDAPTFTPQRSYLHAICAYDRDDALVALLEREKTPVVITQGFIARSLKGDTVLLGRGGSDVSAAYLAAKLGAARCEIWTDVPGMYTANPHQVPTARLLKKLDYDEAQEIASTGAKVLHPRCLTPVRHAHIPLEIRWTDQPNYAGTTISAAAASQGAQVKAISAKRGITLVAMETMAMWQEVGFLADIFSCFKRHGLSIDLISTSETNVTVTLDRVGNACDAAIIDALVRDLSSFCQARTIDGVAVVSLVGKNIRTILHELTPALEVFEDHNIYLVSQASNDLNLTFVVDEEQADKLVAELHGQLFGTRKDDELLGPMWKELFEVKKSAAPVAAAPWWHAKREALVALAQERAPRYVYDEETIGRTITRLKELQGIDRAFYSIKANAYPEILRMVHAADMGFECVAAAEVARVYELFPDIDPHRILFTPNFVPRAEYEYALAKGTWVTLDNLFPLEAWPALFKGKEILVRMDPGRGRGHHKYVHTAGTKSKFGVPSTQIEEFARLARAAGAKVIGLHAHVGSNIFEPETWSEVANYLVEVAKQFPDVRIIDIGGGLGVVERPGHVALDLAEVDAQLCAVKKAHPRFEMWTEPGRYVVAEAGVLLARVTQTKQKGEYYYVGVDAGMNSLIRPALYGAYHEIVNLSRLDDPATTVAQIVGPICESGDILGHARAIAAPEEGDVILIATAGAYGRVMSSQYNLRAPAEEYFLKRK